ncbi:MAG: hypothetical protein PHF79_03860 [Candidatus Pacebacteria bacterium]|nr:hypothetical protein [Candidatus Paceibacterota bacterium]
MEKTPKKITLKIIHIFIYIFAVIGFFLTAGYIAVSLGWTNTAGIIDLQSSYFQKAMQNGQKSGSIQNCSTDNTCAWAQSAEWQAFKAAIVKDTSVIAKVSSQTDISSRMIVSVIMVEQMRLFYTDRESFKKFFDPLKILGSMTQFSWGVAGIKPETALQIENNLASTTSPFYPGKKYEHLLDFSVQASNQVSEQTSNTAATSSTTATSSIETERFTRMTDQHNRYYSYLYAALNMRELENQWRAAGFDISKQVGILATLFNIGFEHSTPNANPQVGGAEITIDGTTYSFGGLALQFYNSDELTDVFPR